MQNDVPLAASCSFVYYLLPDWYGRDPMFHLILPMAFGGPTILGPFYTLSLIKLVRYFVFGNNF